MLKNHLLIRIDGSYESGQVQSYIVPLKKGFYPFRFEYIKKDADGGFQLFYITQNDPGTGAGSDGTAVHFKFKYLAVTGSFTALKNSLSGS